MVKMWISIGFACMLSACGAQSNSLKPPGSQPSLEELRSRYWQSDTILVLFPGIDETLGQQYADIVGKMANSGRSRRKTLCIPFEKVPGKYVKRYPSFLIGTPSSNETIRKTLSKMDIQVNSEGILFQNAPLGDTTSSLVIGTYPHPVYDSIPISFITSHSDEVILSRLEKMIKDRRRFYLSRWGYEVYKQDERLLVGNFSQQAHKRWALDYEEHWDFSDDPKLIQKSLSYEIYTVGIDHLTSDLTSLTDRIAEHQQKVQSFFEWNDPVSDLKYYLYPSCEYKGLRTGNADAIHIEENQALHLVWDDFFLDEEHYHDILCWINQQTDSVTLPFLKLGLSCYLTEKWFEKGYQYWSAKMDAADVMPSLQMLVKKDFGTLRSGLMVISASALAVEFLLDKWGKKKFLEIYPYWDPSLKEIDSLETEWSEYRRKLSQSDIGITANQGRKVTDKLPMLKGFNFAHEGYQVYNGYLSAKAQESIHALKDIGSNTISIIPYSYMNSIHAPSPFYIPTSAGSENDESVICSIHYAQHAGMEVMLKPQIWIGRGGWVGEVEMQSEEDWKAFFQYYTDWMAHYAMIAQRYQVELLCVGVELSKTTVSHPEEWKKMIQNLRHIYDGNIVYAANWGEEFEQITFWDELDYIGVDNYYPLSEKVNPGDDELREKCREDIGYDGKNIQLLIERKLFLLK